jgi:hypothetical protein
VKLHTSFVVAAFVSDMKIVNSVSKVSAELLKEACVTFIVIKFGKVDLVNSKLILLAKNNKTRERKCSEILQN